MSQIWLATPQKAQGPTSWRSLSAIVTEDQWIAQLEQQWIAQLEQQRVEADLMDWDLAVEHYCSIERTIWKKQDTISSAKLEWPTQTHFGVS